MRYNCKPVYGKGKLIGFAYDKGARIAMQYTVFLPCFVESGHNPPPLEPDAEKFSLLSPTDFPEYVTELFSPLRVGDAFMTDDLPEEIDSIEKMKVISGWFRAKAKEMSRES